MDGRLVRPAPPRLADDVRALLEAIVRGRLAWTPFGALVRAGHRKGLIRRLIKAGWLDRWERDRAGPKKKKGHPEGLQVTLSPYGAYLYGTAILGRPAPPPLRGLRQVGPDGVVTVVLGRTKAEDGARSPSITTAERRRLVEVERNVDGWRVVDTPRGWRRVPVREQVEEREQLEEPYWDASGRGRSPRVAPERGRRTLDFTYLVADAGDTWPSVARARRKAPSVPRSEAQYDGERNARPWTRNLSVRKSRTSREFFKYDGATAYND
jgi:hypothetical protein